MDPNLLKIAQKCAQHLSFNGLLLKNGSKLMFFVGTTWKSTKFCIRNMKKVNMVPDPPPYPLIHPCFGLRNLRFLNFRWQKRQKSNSSFKNDPILLKFDLKHHFNEILNCCVGNLSILSQTALIEVSNHENWLKSSKMDFFARFSTIISKFVKIVKIPTQRLKIFV